MSDTFFELMSPQRLERTINRISLEIVEKTSHFQQITLYGLNERGYKVAEWIKSIVEKQSNRTVELLQLDVDNSSIQKSIHSLDDSFVVLIDDVIFSGQTIKKALQLLEEIGNPKVIKLAVLIDRGHRTYPVEPEFCGMVYPTKLKEHVEALLPDSKDGKNKIVLFDNT